MPEDKLKFYRLIGWARVKIYSQAEMATALGLTVLQLIAAVEQGRLCYHAHPLATRSEYEFNQIAYDDNIKRMKTSGDEN